MNDLPRIADFMARDPVCCQQDQAIGDAVTLLLKHKISGLPVVDAGGALVGVLTAKDCFRAALDASYYEGWTGLVGDFMTADPKTLDAELDIVCAAQEFLKVSYRRFPVKQDGHLVGMISRTDALRALNDAWRR